MVDMQKQIAYWRKGAEEDWLVGRDLVLRGSIRHGLFFVHLSVEKTLKGHVCRTTGELAPPIHNLVRLAERAGLKPSEAHVDLMAEINELNIEGRYPQDLLPSPSPEEAKEVLTRVQELRQWLNSQF